jgi:iron complex outermembrane recepter protein
MRRATLMTGAFAAGCFALAEPALAQEVQELVVTGSRGAPRTVIESATPIDVISGVELEKTGRAGAFQSLNLPARAGGSTSTVIATGGLRGLNPDQTLVLVNGKRRHKTSLINAVSSLYNGSVPADLDHLPTSAIGRIEVLRDGAAAQYGSDAIAGVINIILKDSNGGFVGGSYGQNFDRGDGELWQMHANYGFDFAGGDGHLNLSLDAKDQKLSNRAVPVASTVQIYPRINGLPDPREATVDRLITLNSGVLPQMGVNFGYNLTWEISEAATFYSFGTLSRRISDLPFTVRTPNNVNTLPEIYPEGFRPNLVIRERDYEAAFGFRGELSGWSWDVSTTYGRNRATENTSNTLNASLGPTSPTVFYIGALKSTEWVNSLDLTRAFELEGAGELQVSLGAQHRRETYAVSEGEPLSYAAGLYVIPAGRPFAGQRPQTGAQATPGFQPSDASSSSRNNVAGYAELGWTPSERIFLGAAARYEDYDDASGDTLVGKINGRVELTDWLAVRAAVSTGFRAPGLAQQNYAASQSQFRLVNGVLELLQIKTRLATPAARGIGKPQPRRHGGAAAEPGHHHRRLSHRCGQADRHHLNTHRHGGLEHPDRQRPAGRAQRAVLHQRHRHADRGGGHRRHLADGSGRMGSAAGQRRLQPQRHQHPQHQGQSAAAHRPGRQLRALRSPEPRLPDRRVPQGQDRAQRQLDVERPQREPAPDPVWQVHDPAKRGGQ